LHQLSTRVVQLFFLVWNPQASAPISSGTHIDRGVVTRLPGSAWLEGTPAMDHGMNGKRTHMQSNKREMEQNTHQEIMVFIYLFVHIFDCV